MGKFGCRLYCWGCGGCCLITGVIVGVLGAIIPGSMMASIQESAFDLAFVDDTSQSEAEGLFADAGAAIAESDAFKAWGKSIKEGFDDCMKADFAFDWDKSPDDCIDALHPSWMLWNITNADAWGQGGLLEVQEVGPFIFSKDPRNVEADTAYWDSTGKARYRIEETYGNSVLCDQVCEDFVADNTVITANMWYGIWAGAGIGDGWTFAHAVTTIPADTATSSISPTLRAYLTATDPYPMDPHSAVPLPVKTLARTVDLLTFAYTPNAAKLGAISVANNAESAALQKYLWGLGATYLASMAPAYGTPASVTPTLIKTGIAAVGGWGAMPIWIDPISSAMFTLNLVGGASGRIKLHGPGGPTAYLEKQMSSAFYFQGLGYEVAHWENVGPTTSYGMCAFDLDCPPGPCGEKDSLKANCVPFEVAGTYDGGKIPGTYFGSPKGQPGVPQFDITAEDGWRTATLKSSGRIAFQVKYKGPSFDPELEKWDFEGFLVISQFKASSWYRRLENCNYPTGRVIDDTLTDSPGIDCNFVGDTAPMTDTGIPLYWTILIRDWVAAGWDPAITNAEGGPKQTTFAAWVTTKHACGTNKLCTHDFFNAKGPAFTQMWTVAYEPNLGVMIDISVNLGLAWKLVPSPMHPKLMETGFKFIPICWTWVWLHLPGSINMDLSKLQAIPAALNGFYIFLLAQCLTSLVGGFACCFCGI